MTRNIYCWGRPYSRTNLYRDRRFCSCQIWGQLLAKELFASWDSKGWWQEKRYLPCVDYIWLPKRFRVPCMVHYRTALSSTEFLPSRLRSPSPLSSHWSLHQAQHSRASDLCESSHTLSCVSQLLKAALQAYEPQCQLSASDWCRTQGASLLMRVQRAKIEPVRSHHHCSEEYHHSKSLQEP